MTANWTNFANLRENGFRGSVLPRESTKGTKKSEVGGRRAEDRQLTTGYFIASSFSIPHTRKALGESELYFLHED